MEPAGSQPASPVPVLNPLENPSMKKILIAAVACVLGSAVTAWAADAKSNWDDNCAKCHGPDGKGDTKMGHRLGIGDFTDAAVQAKFTDEQAAVALKVGLQDKDGKTRMKAIEGLSDDDIKALVQYVRGLKK
jgi:mono/diheme cytochrome c family protein